MDQDALGRSAHLVSSQGGDATVETVERNGAKQTKTYPRGKVWAKALEDGGKAVGLFNLGDQPITDIALDAQSGELFVSTDFGVNTLRPGSTQWVPAAGSLPPVAVYGLTIDSNARILYAATHGRGAWRLDLR